jgi:hypothetical protein
MLGFLRRRRARKMQRLLMVAQLATVERFVRDHSSQRPDLSERAAAAANYLFGNSAMPVRAQLDLTAERANARQWLKDNQRIRELVIQSLRVANVIGWAEAGVGSGVGLELLEAFGKEFPVSPKLSTYRGLVRRFVESLPASKEKAKLEARLAAA